MLELINDVKDVAAVFGDSPTGVIRRIELDLPQLTPGSCSITNYLENASVSSRTLMAALNLKRTAGQINVIVHALGLLISLPHILEPNERIISITLGAGNTGKPFDLVTDLRVAEFKFIQWQGGAESIRQNSVFVDFLKLLWDESGKKKYLFLTGNKEPLAFLNGGRALSSVLSRNSRVKSLFDKRYGTQFRTVGDFYQKYSREVEIIDLRQVVPTFAHAEG